MISSTFLESNVYVIDQKGSFFKMESSFTIYNAKRQCVGYIKENQNTLLKIATFIANKKYKKMLPFHFDITDVDGNLIASICRDWSILQSGITINGSEGEEIAKLHRKAGVGTSFDITDFYGHKVASISGDFFNWSFKITDGLGNQLGSIEKKWEGTTGSFFGADNYAVVLRNAIDDPAQRIAVISAAIAIDKINHD